MVGRTVISRFGTIVRNFRTSAARKSDHHDAGGIVGENLPFDVNSLVKFTTIFALFIGSASATPFLILRHQLLKH